MATKEKLSRGEIEAMFLAEIQQIPGCENVETVAMTGGGEDPWEFIVQRDGPELDTASVNKFAQIANSLSEQYELYETPRAEPGYYFFVVCVGCGAELTLHKAPSPAEEELPKTRASRVICPRCRTEHTYRPGEMSVCELVEGKSRPPL